jgi:hypothetical protein
LSQALLELGDVAALAAVSEERAADLPDVPYEVCQAAISLAACAERIRGNDDISDEARAEQTEQYATRAAQLLEDGLAQYDDDLAIWTVGDAYLQVGDHLVSAELAEPAQRAFQSALAIFTDLQARQPEKNRHEFDEAINSTKGRIASLSISPSLPVKLTGDGNALSQ